MFLWSFLPLRWKKYRFCYHFDPQKTQNYLKASSARLFLARIPFSLAIVPNIHVLCSPPRAIAASDSEPLRQQSYVLVLGDCALAKQHPVSPCMISVRSRSTSSSAPRLPTVLLVWPSAQCPSSKLLRHRCPVHWSTATASFWKRFSALFSSKLLLKPALSILIPMLHSLFDNPPIVQ